MPTDNKFELEQHKFADLQPHGMNTHAGIKGISVKLLPPKGSFES